MTSFDDHLERQLDELFVEGCDPYQAAAVALRGRAPDAIDPVDREVVKRVFVRVSALRGGGAREGHVQDLRRAAELFHRIVGSLSAERLLSREMQKMPTVLYDKLVASKLSSEEMAAVAADGFELCVRSLAELGASGVTIHECGDRDFEDFG